MNRGFTLVEILVVIGVIGVIIAMGALMDLYAYKTDTLLSEESKIVAILQKARSRSMSNFFESAHGVCYIAPDYVIFREEEGHCVDGESTNELISANDRIAEASDFDTDFPTIVFIQLAGTTGNDSIHVTDGINTKDIDINNEGTINW